MHPLHVASSCAPAGVAEIWWASLKRAIGAVVARFVHTEEVTGSNPVSPTKSETGSGLPNHPQRPGE